MIIFSPIHFLTLTRDVKPSNFLYNRNTNQYLLVDFGLAQYINDLVDEKEKRNAVISSKSVDTDDVGGELLTQKAPRAGTRGFRAPEILLRVRMISCYRRFFNTRVDVPAELRD